MCSDKKRTLKIRTGASWELKSTCDIYCSLTGQTDIYQYRYIFFSSSASIKAQQKLFFIIISPTETL